MPRVLVPLATGFEEIEAVTLVDVLRRAGVDVVVAALEGDEVVVGAHDLRLVPDCSFEGVEDDFDLVVLPGGAEGAQRLARHSGLLRMLRQRVAARRPVAAICAAPQVLDEAGILPEGAFTCYPGWEARLRTEGRRHERVVDAGEVITSQGPATAMEFALHLVGRLCGSAREGGLARELLQPPSAPV